MRRRQQKEILFKATVTFFATKMCPNLIEASQIVGKCSSLQSVAQTKDEFSHFCETHKLFFLSLSYLFSPEKKEEEEKMRIVCALEVSRRALVIARKRLREAKIKSLGKRDLWERSA